MAGAVERQKREHETALWAMWHVPHLVWADPEKMPSLDEFMGRKKRRRQTAEEQVMIARLWHTSVNTVQ